MTEAIEFAGAISTIASAILAALDVIVRDAPPPQRQSYRRHRPWNFK